MTTITQLRKAVKLPPHYKVKMPKGQRCEILLNLLAEYKLASNLEKTYAGKPKVVIESNLAVNNRGVNSRAYPMLKALIDHGDNTISEVSRLSGVEIARAQSATSAQTVEGRIYVVRKEPSETGRMINVIGITDGGRAWVKVQEYQDKIDRQ